MGAHKLFKRRTSPTPETSNSQDEGERIIRQALSAMNKSIEEKRSIKTAAVRLRDSVDHNCSFLMGPHKAMP